MAPGWKPSNTLYPADLRQRANVNRWLFWGASHWGPALAALTFENWLKALLKLGEPDRVQVRRQDEALRSLAAVLDQHLSSRDWVCGASITIADLAIAAPLGIAERAKFSVRAFPAVQRWFERVQALDAWKSTAPPVLPPSLDQ